MGENKTNQHLVLDAMRLAERAHRTRPQGPHHRKAPDNVRALSCADKTANMRDMIRLLAKGHPECSFTKLNHATGFNVDGKQ